jgi:hypothetical protein
VQRIFEGENMLSGNLELFALADVLRFVARSGATGAVNIYRPSEAGRVLLLDGVVVGASVEAFEAADQDGVIEAGLRLLEVTGGDFALDIEDVEGPAHISVEEFLKTVARRRAEWRKIVAAIGSLDEPLYLVPQLPEGTQEITLSPLEWQIAVHSDGHRSLREIAREVSTSDFSVATAVLAMANAGLLALPGGHVAPDLSDPDLSDGVDDDEAEDEDAADYEGHFEASDAADEADESASEEAGEEGGEDDHLEHFEEEDPDPALLLRELGQEKSGPRARRLTAASRQEQALRLRSR